MVQTTDMNDPGEILEGLYYCVINNGSVAVRSKSAYIRGTLYVCQLINSLIKGNYVIHKCMNMV